MAGPRFGPCNSPLQQQPSCHDVGCCCACAWFRRMFSLSHFLLASFLRGDCRSRVMQLKVRSILYVLLVLSVLSVLWSLG